MSSAKLNQEALSCLAERLPLWQLSADQSSLHRRFEFDDFAQAFAFMAQMAKVSEEMDHHPDWRNVYRHVEVTLTTHDAGGLTQLDLKWAAAADLIKPS
ncbi:MAG: hypothetical protein RL307_876 [Pseudomonadota bacterium]|jgi:4a-hydroxytetrahydrobiopterin dehydratase